MHIYLQQMQKKLNLPMGDLQTHFRPFNEFRAKDGNFSWAVLEFPLTFKSYDFITKVLTIPSQFQSNKTR